MKKKKLKQRKCYMCGCVYDLNKSDKIFCSQSCNYQQQKSYASDCYGFNNKLTV